MRLFCVDELPGQLKLNSYSNASVFLSLCHMRISVFWGQEHLTDRSISKRYLKSDIATWVEKVQLQERYTLMTQDSIGHLKTLCMSVLSLVVVFESEWKCYSSSQSDKKMLVFEYEHHTYFKEITNQRIVKVEAILWLMSCMDSSSV